MSPCHRCGTELTWAINERNNRRMPLEPAGDRDTGLFVLRRRHRLGPPEAIAVGPALFDTEPKYVFHQCPPEREYSQSLDFPEGF